MTRYYKYGKYIDEALELFDGEVYLMGGYFEPESEHMEENWVPYYLGWGGELSAGIYPGAITPSFNTLEGLNRYLKDNFERIDWYYRESSATGDWSIPEGYIHEWYS